MLNSFKEFHASILSESSVVFDSSSAQSMRALTTREPASGTTSASSTPYFKSRNHRLATKFESFGRVGISFVTILNAG